MYIYKHTLYIYVHVTNVLSKFKITTCLPNLQNVVGNSFISETNYYFCSILNPSHVTVMHVLFILFIPVLCFCFVSLWL